MLLFLTCLIQSIEAQAGCLHEADGENPKPTAAGAAAKTRAGLGFTSVWRAAVGEGRVGLKQTARETLTWKVKPGQRSPVAWVWYQRLSCEHTKRNESPGFGKEELCLV